MGNLSTSCQMSNYSKRNVRVYVEEKSLDIDAFLVSQPGGDEDKGVAAVPGLKKFSFRPEMTCTRVMASETKEVPWNPLHYLSVFVEDEEDKDVCCKQIIHNMALSAPITVLLYDV